MALTEGKDSKRRATALQQADTDLDENLNHDNDPFHGEASNRHGAGALPARPLCSRLAGSARYPMNGMRRIRKTVA